MIDRTPQQALAALLDRYAPQTLLVVSAERFPALEAFTQAHPGCEVTHCPPAALPAQVAGRRFELAVVLDCLEHLPKRDALQLLGGIRNLNSPRLAVLVDLAAAGWANTDFYALALQATERFARDGQALALYTYDVKEYKHVPDWLNARFWANPENFGKYWW